MNLALFSDTYSPQVNGVARTLTRLVTHLESRNINYHLFVPDHLERGDHFRSNIHSFTSYPFFLYPECRIAWPNPLKMKKELSAFAPTVIHVTTPFNVGLSGLHYSKKHHIPLIGSYHTHFDYYLHYYKLTFLTEVMWSYLRWFYGSCQKVFVPSVETRDHLNKQGLNRLDIWSRGVDCHQYQPSKKEGFLYDIYSIERKYILLYVGRMAPEKDLATLKKIMRQLPSELRAQIHWIYVGDGPMLREMKDEFTGDHVTFTGYLNGEALAAIYALADLFIFPSQTETFGNVVLEALASGTPAIVANKGGVKEIVRHRQTGMICEAGNSLSFVNAITELLTQPTKRLHMNLEARAYARTQSWEAIFDRLLSEYEKASNSSHRTKHLA
ncbi:glycosyltransferase family 1 protein [Alkalihalophilus lindianensis]|uniref:Glycosyltransferase family 1 protein n=1 Tax=Alkalihalophilus lindianensis TaxID=1630542 RepID=A0ABU3XER5_9BACI|nr:glycosyltransferase family 1 protein [Alkalihalophilus lindianensis]MDV2686371.1 glycosyltransferase family 1 protein [Alkalihalophilus lindianensis]